MIIYTCNPWNMLAISYTPGSRNREDRMLANKLPLLLVYTCNIGLANTMETPDGVSACTDKVRRVRAWNMFG